MLVIDDAHHLDNWSATVALTLASTTDSRLLITARSDAPMSDAVVALWKDGYLSRLDLSPFDIAGTTELVGALAGSEVAMPTVRLLHQWTGGNPLYLTELVRYARSAGRLVDEGGLRWWRGPLVVPPRLAELFDRWLRDLDDRQADALAAVALGEPLPLAVLESVAPGAVESLDDKGLLCTTDLGGRIVVRLGQPMLGAVLGRKLPRLRRRRLAARLLAASDPAPATTVDLVTMARWQLDASGPIDVRLLIRAADATSRDDPELAIRLARRAMESTDAAAVPLADALVELGDVAEARFVLEQARDAAGTPGGRLRSSIALAAHRCWVDRDPTGAHQDLADLHGSTRSRIGRATLDGLDALVLLFGGQTTESRRVAERVLGDSPGPARGPGAVSARLALATSLALAGQTGAAQATLAGMAASLAQPWSAPSYAHGAAAAALGFAELWCGADAPIPSSAPAFGRLPNGPDRVGHPLAEWPLLAGCARWLSGDHREAIGRLREALVQQSGGQRLFRAEAACWLAMCLAEVIAAARAAQALHRGAAEEMVDHATRLDELSMHLRAWQLVDAAGATLSTQDGMARGRAAVLLGRLRRRSGISAPAAPRTGLTDRELEIASLAAGGLTDREISGRLTLSVRTVQSHLARIYRKLGVHSRRDLPFGL